MWFVEMVILHPADIAAGGHVAQNVICVALVTCGYKPVQTVIFETLAVVVTQIPAA